MIQLTDKEKKFVDLAKPEVFEDYKDYVEYLFMFNILDEAYAFVKGFPKVLADNAPILSKTNPQVFEGYQELLLKAKAVAIPFLDEKDLVELFEKNLHFLAKTQDLDLLYKLEAKLVTIMFLEARDRFKKQLLDSVNHNLEFITSKPITLQKNEIAPTASSWLKDYVQNVGGFPVDKLKKAQYLVNGDNVKKLGAEEKETIIRLFNLYDYLNQSSDSPEGLEEEPTFELEDGRLVTLHKGVIERVPTLAEEPLIQKMLELTLMQETRDQVISSYAIRDLIDENVAKEIDNIVETTQSDTAKIKDLFYEALTKSDKVKGVALLEVVATIGVLPDLLLDERFSNLFLTYLKSSGNLQGVERLRVSPKSPQNVKGFIKFVLQDRLGLEESTAARVAVKIGNLLGDEYKEMAYFDARDNKFKWM